MTTTQAREISDFLEWDCGIDVKNARVPNVGQAISDFWKWDCGKLMAGSPHIKNAASQLTDGAHPPAWAEL
jgi:hypothetical protein